MTIKFLFIKFPFYVTSCPFGRAQVQKKRCKLCDKMKFLKYNYVLLAFYYLKAKIMKSCNVCSGCICMNLTNVDNFIYVCIHFLGQDGKLGTAIC